MAEPFTILVMPGDGIGPEITSAAVEVLNAVVKVCGLDVAITEFECGTGFFEKTGRYLSEEAEERSKELAESGQGAILFGAVENEPIATLRLNSDLFANVRPLKMVDALAAATKLRPEHVRGMDILIVRELVSGLYYGVEGEGTDDNGRWATQEMRYHETEIRRIARIGFERAQSRRGKMTFVHKQNAIPKVFALWAAVLEEERANYPDVALDDILVDNMAMQLVLRPRDFDVLLCPNLFGDILSDLGAGIIGSIGVCPSASLNANQFGLYESIGGCAPDIAGKNIANPISTILSVAMMCRISLNHSESAQMIEDACSKVLETYRTSDIWEPQRERVGTREMGELIAQEVLRNQS